MFDKSIDHGNDVMVVQFGEKEKLQQNWTSKLSYTVKKNRQQFSMVCTLINHENDVKNVPNFTVKPLTSGSWFHFSFEHFDISMR